MLSDKENTDGIVSGANSQKWASLTKSTQFCSEALFGTPLQKVTTLQKVRPSIEFRVRQVGTSILEPADIKKLTGLPC